MDARQRATERARRELIQESEDYYKDRESDFNYQLEQARKRVERRKKQEQKKKEKELKEALELINKFKL